MSIFFPGDGKIGKLSESLFVFYLSFDLQLGAKPTEEFTTQRK